jgi:hypothetical protein
MIEIDAAGSDTGSMNPIALIEATAAARSAVSGALATDPVVPGGRAGPAVYQPVDSRAGDEAAAASAADSSTTAASSKVTVSSTIGLKPASCQPNRPSP